MRTSLLSVQPRYDYRDGRSPVLAGYELANVVEVTVRDLGALGDVVDGTLGAGATSMDALTSGWPTRRPAEREARTPGDGRGSVTGRGPGRGRRSDDRWGDRHRRGRGASPPPMPRPKAERMVMAADAATPVEAGRSRSAVTVTVTYRTR